MANIFYNQQRLVEENLFRFRLTNTVLVGALPGVASVPLEAEDSIAVKHLLYMTKIYGT